jgi:hypothetical protein
MVSCPTPHAGGERHHSGISAMAIAAIRTRFDVTEENHFVHRAKVRSGWLRLKTGRQKTCLFIYNFLLLFHSCVPRHLTFWREPPDSSGLGDVPIFHSRQAQYIDFKLASQTSP